MSEHGSDSSSLEDLPVYFKPFSRESLKAIHERIEEEKIRQAEEARKLKEQGLKKPKPVDDDDEDEGPQHDSKLEQGCSLPVRLSHYFTEDFANMPLEELDPFYKTIPTFVFVTKKKDIFRFSADDAMWCLSPFNPVRRVAMAILTHGMFSLIIITTILLNCYQMITPATPLTESTEVVFTAIYTFESAVKVLARGFILSKFTYLRDAWNWLDFCVIALAYITMGIDLGNLGALRTCRVFRALKAVAIVPGLKTIVGAVIESVKNLRDVIILTVFALSVFGLIGLQIYMGVLTQKCVADFPEDGSEGEERDINWHTWNLNFTNWYPYPPPAEYGAADYPLCGNSTGAGTCPENFTCLQGYGINPNYGYTSFDSFGNAFLASFRLMTQDFWESLYQQILRSAGPWHMLFFIVIIFLGSYYLVNLILAIVAMSYDELQKKAEEEEMADNAEMELILAEEAARAAKILKHDNYIAHHPEGADGGGGGGGHGDPSDPQKSPSGFSSRSYESWGGGDEGGGREGKEGGKGLKSEGNVSSFAHSNSRLHTSTDIQKRMIVSLPGSPYNNRRGSQLNHGRDKLMVLSTYMDAQEHLPYADDSTAATPMSEENGAIVLPFCNGLHYQQHHHPHFGLGSRHSSYDSHASRISYTSHDVLSYGHHRVGLVPCVTKESQLIQRAKNIYGGDPEKGHKHIEGEAKSVEDMGNNAKKSNEDHNSSAQRFSTATGVDPQDVVTLNEIIEQAAGPPIEEVGEPMTFKELIKAKIWEGCLFAVDFFCLWDFGFPWSLFKKIVAFIVFDAFAELFITLAIVVNTVFMALDHYGLEENYTMNAMLKAGNMVFTTIFTLETSMKIIAMSPKFFFQIGWNVFDFIIVFFSLVEVVFEDANLPGLSALRSFRLLRIFKLAKSWQSLNMILTIMGQTVGSLTNLVFVLVIIIFIFAVMGMQLFSQAYHEKVHLFPGNEMPRWNFNDFGHAFMIIFRVLCGEWIESMWDCMLVNGGACVPYFLATVVIGNLVLLNLFLALLLSAFGGGMAPADDEPNKIAEAFDRIARFKVWVKEGILSGIQHVGVMCVRAKNRIVPGAAAAAAAEEAAAAAAAAEAEAAKQKKKKPKLKDTARLVMNSKKLMNDLAQLKEVEAAAGEGGTVEVGAPAATTPQAPIKELPDIDGMSMKSYGSHTHYPNQMMKKNAIKKEKVGGGGGGGGGDVEGAEGAETDGKAHLADDSEIDEDEEWIEDEFGEGGYDGECIRIDKEEEVEGPADCMPPRFYEKFPIFDVEGTPFGVGWTDIRIKLFHLIEDKYFETAVIAMILLSSLALALEDVHLPGNPILTDILHYMDKIFTVIFFFEMLLKWTALGFVAYFNNSWCWLDFVIVMVSVVNFIASLMGFGKVQAFKTMRTLRALRPLRAMSRMQGMRVVVNALVGSIPSIVNVLLVCLIFWLIFAIMGVQLFNGKFHKCLDPDDGTRPDYRIIRNKVECLANNFTWENSVMNFDHVGKAYLSLFQVATFKGWIGIMNDAIDSREIDEQPHREVSFVMYIYFVIFIIFGSFFTLNLFIGVIIDNFNEQKKQSGGSMDMMMTEDQKAYIAAMKKMGNKKPIKAIPRPAWRPQAIVFDFVTNQKFDMVIMIFIGLNMAIMMMDHYQMSQAWEDGLTFVNTVFVAIFTAESLLKMFAHRLHYFKEPWNLFDVVVVFMSVAGLLLSDLIEKYFVSPTLLRVVRVAKVGRVLRLVKGAKGIRTLLFALAMSLPALFNICLLLFLVMFIFSIFGMSFFMNVKLRGALDDVYNFQTFGQSIILLFQISTSAGWDGVLDGIMNEDDCELPDPELGKTGDCGNTTVGIAFLLAYLVLSFLVIINMYVAVILENYSQATEEVQEGLTDDDYDMYYEIWAQFDPDGTQYIPFAMLSDLLDVLEPPMQHVKPNKFKIITMDIPICRGDMVYCVDILDALTKDFFARKGKAVAEVNEINEVVVPVSRPGYVPISSTLWRQREEYCARSIQAVWRRYKRNREAGVSGGDGAQESEETKDEGEVKVEGAEAEAAAAKSP